MTGLTDLFGEVISSYSRAQAIEDGALVDVSELAREAGFKFPVALTRAAWSDLVEWDADRGGWQDETGRLWDVLSVLRFEIARGQGGDTVRGHVFRVPNVDGAPPEAVPADYWALCGPGDDAEPVITVMLPGED